ncbi:MAG: hypothetical protein JWR00_2317 [Rubritepida sp.]|nr:hypothetical protein [Rubritepida sp.]MDB5412965.1 hypothetical protein [Rubritepida sp.]
MLASSLLALGAALVSAVLGLAIYRLARTLWPVTDREDVDLAAMVIVRVGILHALIVALAFAEVKQNEMHARQLVAEEAVTAANVFYDLERFGAEATLPERRLLVRYAHDMVHGDWPELAAHGRLSMVAWQSWRALVEGVLRLQPTDRRQEMILSRMVANTWKLEDQRQRREADAYAAPHPAFWFTSVVGLVIICGCLAPYPPRGSTYALIAAFSGFTGAVLYLAYDVTTPFHGLWTIHPAGLESFLRQAGPAVLLAGGG